MICDNVLPLYVLAGTLAVTFGYLLYCALLGPTSHIPGPWYTNFTSLVAKYHWINGDRPYHVHGLHKRYGPVVRVAPGEVHVLGVEPVKTIYNTRETFVKSTWYRNMSAVTDDNIINTSNVDLHRLHRRLLSGPMSEGSLRDVWPTVRAKADLAIKKMGEEAVSRGATDVLKWSLFMATDVIGELAFGDSFRTLEQGKKSGYTEDLQAVAPLGALRSTFPSLLPIARVFPIPFIKRAVQGSRNMQRYATESLARYQRLLDSDPTRANQTLFTKAFSASKDGELSFSDIRANAQAYIIAGSDTTSFALTYLIWTTCRRPDIKCAMVAALRALPEDFNDEHLRDLAYLNWLIDETLRVYSPVAAQMPRIVPNGGAELAGFKFPAGVTVTSQAYSMHRDASIFPDPESFIPERWQSPTQAMKDAFIPFGGGSRICIGLHLARMELRYAAAKFFLAFPDAKTSSLEGMCEEDMIPRLFFLPSNRGKRCLIHTA